MLSERIFYLRCEQNGTKRDFFHGSACEYISSILLCLHSYTFLNIFYQPWIIGALSSVSYRITSFYAFYTTWTTAALINAAMWPRPSKAIRQICDARLCESLRWLRTETWRGSRRRARHFHRQSAHMCTLKTSPDRHCSWHCQMLFKCQDTPSKLNVIGRNMQKHKKTSSNSSGTSITPHLPVQQALRNETRNEMTCTLSSRTARVTYSDPRRRWPLIMIKHAVVFMCVCANPRK